MEFLYKVDGNLNKLNNNQDIKLFPVLSRETFMSLCKDLPRSSMKWGQENNVTEYCKKSQTNSQVGDAKFVLTVCVYTQTKGERERERERDEGESKKV